MPLPRPLPGLVIRYSYLWREDHLRGKEEGRKDRPCAVILVSPTSAGKEIVTVLPISHGFPLNASEALEIPPAAKRRLGLDDERSWIVLTEANRFTWPGPDLRPSIAGKIESVAHGFLPRALYRQMREKFLDLLKSRQAKVVTRD